jgi:hypothetical protein
MSCISWACSPSNGMKTFNQRVGRPPLDPLPQASDKYQQRADVGVDRGPGGPPHFVFSTVRRGGQVCELPDW